MDGKGEEEFALWGRKGLNGDGWCGGRRRGGDEPWRPPLMKLWSFFEGGLEFRREGDRDDVERVYLLGL